MRIRSLCEPPGNRKQHPGHCRLQSIKVLSMGNDDLLWQKPMQHLHPRCDPQLRNPASDPHTSQVCAFRLPLRSDIAGCVGARLAQFAMHSKEPRIAGAGCRLLALEQCLSPGTRGRQWLMAVKTASGPGTTHANYSFPNLSMPKCGPVMTATCNYDNRLGVF